MVAWNSDAPIYRQLADRLSSGLLDGDPPDGGLMPSVRTLAGRYLLNPLTVGRALQVLVEEDLLESRRGVGMVVRAGACSRLRDAERARFLAHDWPAVVARVRQLGIAPHELNWEP